MTGGGLDGLGDVPEGALPLDDDVPALEPIDDDELPLDDVSVTGKAVGAEGEVYWYWRIPGRPETAVGYADPTVAVRKGAEVLRADRQRRTMREG